MCACVCVCVCINVIGLKLNLPVSNFTFRSVINKYEEFKNQNVFDLQSLNLWGSLSALISTLLLM